MRWNFCPLEAFESKEDRGSSCLQRITGYYRHWTRKFVIWLQVTIVARKKTTSFLSFSPLFFRVVYLLNFDSLKASAVLITSTKASSSYRRPVTLWLWVSMANSNANRISSVPWSNMAPVTREEKQREGRASSGLHCKKCYVGLTFHPVLREDYGNFVNPFKI